MANNLQISIRQDNTQLLFTESNRLWKITKFWQLAEGKAA